MAEANRRDGAQPRSAASAIGPHRGHAAAPRRVSSTELLGDGLELLIEHAGREYRLRVTQNGKLILTA